MTKNSYFLALSTLIGTVIGAGVFGIPYVISQSGLIPGILYLVILGIALTYIYLFFGEVSLRTKEKQRLGGYARIYLGRWAEALVAFSTVVGTVGALLAYIIIGGDFLRLIVPESLIASDFSLHIILWAILSLFVFRGIQMIAKAELFMTMALFVSVLLIFFFAAPQIQTANYSLVSLPNVVVPFGVILFAFGGWVAIPEIADLFKNKKEKRSLDNIILIALSVVTVFYLLFSLVVIGVSGTKTSPDALYGLIPFLGEKIIVLGAVFGLIAIAASFLVLGNYLKNSLRYDYKVPYMVAASIAVVFPLVLFLLGFREFIQVIGIVGVIVGVIEGTVIVSLFRKAKTKGQREPEYVVRAPHIALFLLPLLLVGGAIATFII